MKLGGLTWWRNNYGSILQAYALQQELNEYENVEYEIICQFGKKIVSVDNLIDKIKKIGIKNTMHRIVWKFCVPGVNRRNQRIQTFVDKYLIISKEQYTDETIEKANAVYDGFVCGSDQIWNTALVNTHDIYWLGFAEKDKIKIAYAPSFGTDEVSDFQIIEIRENLKSFNAISCREKSGTDAINKILNVDLCKTVLDPTMLVHRKLWDNLCLSSRKISCSKPYIFAYMLRGTKQQRKMIESYAKMHRMSIVTIPFLESEKIEMYDFTFGDTRIWDADPIDFINLIRDASLVFTDSFHSTVFSCLYHVPFFIFPKIGAAQMSRLEGLQDLLKIDSRVVHNMDEIIAVEKKQIDWKNVDQELHSWRKISRQYLAEAIEGKQDEGFCI